MLARDIIIIDDLPERIETSIVNKAINYALISIIFTHKKLDLDKLEDWIQNISKGKIAELIFHHFMTQNKLGINFSSCQTPFYLPDKRDFLLNEYEWDIKNNFVRTHHKASSEQLLDLPALVPNRPSSMYFSDQWEKRFEMKHSTSKGLRFVFTFMERPLRNDFIDLRIHNSLQSFFERIKKEYPYKSKEEAPFTESWFWNEMSRVDFPVFKLNQTLRLYITSWAGQEHFPLFFNTDKRNFDGHIYTRIRNKTLKIHRLPAFSSLFPSLSKEMKCGRFLQKKAGD